MRKWIVVLLAMLICASAFAVDIGSVKTTKYVTSGGYAVLDSISGGSDFQNREQFYIFQAQAAEEVVITRKLVDGWDWPGITLKSGQSVMLDVPYIASVGGNGYQTQMIFVTTLTDTLEAISCKSN